MRVGTIGSDFDVDLLLTSISKVLLKDESFLYVCLVNDKRFRYLAITSTRFIFIDPETLTVTRYMSHQHVTKLRFTMGMWHIETKAQPLTYLGLAKPDRKPVLEAFQQLGLPIVT